MILRKHSISLANSKEMLQIFLVLLSSLQALAIVQSPPRIIKQPPTDELLFQVKSRADENDKPFIIECEADGEPAPLYRWSKNGKPFDWQVYDDRISQQPGRGTLVITSPRDEDIGQYQCFATNEWGTATTNSVFVRKSELNNFKDEPPKTETVEEGLPFGIVCSSPDGWPPPSVYWMLQGQNWLKTINSSRLTVDPEGELWFSNVTRKDASEDFLYACSAASYFRNEYKLGNRVHLQVIQSGSSAGLQNKHEPVKQYCSKRNEVTYRGKEMKLWCIYGGTPLPEIRWRKQGGALPWGRTTFDNYGKTLVIKHVDFEDEGDYTCEASNGVGLAQSYSINLKVLAKPRFLIEPEIQTAAEGEEVTFECEADGKPDPRIVWIHNGQPLVDNDNPNRFVSPSRITIKNLKKGDTGNYGCNATNEVGYVYKDVYVNVLALPPEITTGPEKMAQTVDGKTITLTCRTFGAPRPIVKWFHDDDELTGGRYEITTEGDLMIREVKFFDAGDYLCNATNKFGWQSAKGSLVVKEHTRITGSPQDYEVEASDSATFRCNAVYDSDLHLAIKWLKDGELIDFDVEPRFIQSSDQSLTITKTTELDSGRYTCRAESDLDFAEASATLIVQDVPNPPQLRWVDCNAKDATVVWQPMGDNRAPILTYKIQYNTSFTPDTWETATDIVPATDTSFKVSMSPWSNYTFRVIARNKVGESLPSGHSKTCLTPEDVPSKNPDNVEGRGTAPNNLVIYWTPMPEIEHNAPKFKYRIYWRQDKPGERWKIEDLADWRLKEILIPNQPTYSKYKIKVVAHNQKGEANVAAEEVLGYSGEDIPAEAPTSFALQEVVGPRSAIVSWEGVNKDSIRGEFKGYKIQTWTLESGEEKFREIIMKSDSTRSLVQSFKPFATNFARVLAFNGAYNGPPSNIISFNTPEGKPGPVDMLECFPMGSSALLLAWKQPQEVNGVLTGYRIYYQEVDGTKLGPLLEREPRIMKNRTDKAKLAGLEAYSKYRVTIRATTSAGEGMPYYTECDTNPQSDEPPSRPRFKYIIMNAENGFARIKVTWMPHIEGNPGSHFYVQYKKDMETQFLSSNEELNEDSIVVRGLDPDETYDFRVVAVDGKHQTPSRILPVYTYSSLPSSGASGYEPIAHSGWFIGMLAAVIFLLLICLAVCIVKRNRGGKYAVQESEERQGRRDPYDEGGFPEYTQPLDDRHLGGGGTMTSDLKLPPESDTDSIADYADGENTAGLDEDGSFIGKYRKDRNPEQSSAFATLV
ncbi:hypothetical protein TCAL_04520 [Tigriopus californicus]|uniref:Neuroglian n=1 Tax=Tigriopus californicus TaxID=6832 RepID=A0A553PD24_TIGCA|nr:hypothetical protein TCAL_04520 [Tigriopus californicus]